MSGEVMREYLLQCRRCGQMGKELHIENHSMLSELHFENFRSVWRKHALGSRAGEPSGAFEVVPICPRCGKRARVERV